MADNVVADPGVGGAEFGTDEILGVHYPRSKLVWGVDGTVVDASATDPLPVVQTGTPGLPTGAATSAKQDTEIASLASIDGKLTTGIAIAGAVEVMNDAGNPLPVNGTVAVTNLDVALSTRLKAADTLAGVTTVGAVTAITNALPVGANSIGQVTANAGTNLNTSLLGLETTQALIRAKTDNIPAQGQALAAASMPVVLTAAQVTTLTPPAAITGFALEAGNLATILAALGTASVDTAAASTMLNLLTQLGKKMDANTKAVTSQTATLVSALPKPLAPRSSTLLHRN